MALLEEYNDLRIKREESIQLHCGYRENTWINMNMCM
jgi:hypothetical protein